MAIESLQQEQTLKEEQRLVEELELSRQKEQLMKEQRQWQEVEHQVSLGMVEQSSTSLIQSVVSEEI